MSQDEWIREWQAAQELRWHVPASTASTETTMHTEPSNYGVIGQTYRLRGEEARHASADQHHEWAPADSSMGMVNFWPLEGHGIQGIGNYNRLVQYQGRGAAANGALLQGAAQSSLATHRVDNINRDEFRAGGLQLHTDRNTNDLATMQFLAPAQGTWKVLSTSRPTVDMQVDARSSTSDHPNVELAGANRPMQREENMTDSSRPSIEPQIIRKQAGAGGGKDRHTKVKTAKGLRDRRVRLSVSTAMQFYDIQDRLGFQQPSRVFEWLMTKAKPAIDQLPGAANHHDVNDSTLPVVSTDHPFPASPEPASTACGPQTEHFSEHHESP